MAGTGTGAVLNRTQPANTGTGVSLSDDNNIVVSANDDTTMTLVTASLGGGLVGVGASVGVALATKHTNAYLGSNNVVIVKAQGGALNGHQGLAVEATSPEKLVGFVASVAVGFV